MADFAYGGGDGVDIGDLPSFRKQSDFDFKLENYSSTGNQQGFDDYGRGYQNQLPSVVEDFILHFHRQLRERNVYEIHTLYENTFNKLTDKFYSNCTWPSIEVIAPLVNNDGVFLTLYKEMYYRHIYTKLQPTLEHRFESFTTYQDLFSYILNAKSPVPLDLPNVWLWDIIDEYIYQFQSFCQYRHRIKKLSPEEIHDLRANPQVWSVQTVLATLHSLVSKSNIVALLEREKQQPDVPITANDAGFEFGASPLYKVLGYFSIIGLCRVHCLLGDYYLALKTLDPIDLSNKRALFTRVTACHITVAYYHGFACLMMRRYVDAIFTWSKVLLYISRTKQFHTRSYQYEQMEKKNDHMFSLLAIAMALCPQHIDENVEKTLLDMHGDNMLQMQKDITTAKDLKVFEDLFSFGCPKFVSPFAPNYDDDTNTHQEPVKLQTKLFLDEVRQQYLLPTVRSFLKLYTTMGVPKLADFLDMDEADFRALLLCYKQKTRGKTWVSGPPLSGEVRSSSDVEFFVDQDMVHIADTKVATRYGDYFIRNIQKWQDACPP